MLPWNQTSFFYLEDTGMHIRSSFVPSENGLLERAIIHQLFNKCGEWTQKEREHCWASSVCLHCSTICFAFYHILKTIIWDRHEESFHICRMCWSLNIYWTLNLKPTHVLSSLQHGEFMFREFKNYPMSLFFMQGTELNIDSACFKARSLKSGEGNLPLKHALSNKKWWVTLKKEQLVRYGV